jgi:recombination protein RecR
MNLSKELHVHRSTATLNNMNNDAIEKLTELFMQFPGIGRKQAGRFVYSLLHRNEQYINELVTNIRTLKQYIKQCDRCFRFYPDNQQSICTVCQHSDPATLLVVEKDADLINVQKTKMYQGSYFVLGGFISSHDNKRSFARVAELLQRIEQDYQQNILKEIIFGLSLSPEGEHTRLRLISMIKDRVPGLNFSTLGRGLSTGTELEYSDEATLKYALQSRISE